MGGIGCVVIFPSNLPLSTVFSRSFSSFYMRSPWLVPLPSIAFFVFFMIILPYSLSFPTTGIIMDLLIAVPTYNEAQNIEPFIKAVFENTPSQAEILVVDDNSPDGTAKIVEEMIPAGKNRLHILNRPEKQGLGKAYLAAFDWGLSRGYDVFLEMDADFSHNPRIFLAQACGIAAGMMVNFAMSKAVVFRKIRIS
jgi:hypothetical protein